MRDMSLAIQLDLLEARILGVLIEKEFTTPDQYPLSLHALVTGCNQKSNRDPEMSVSEHEVEQAILRLRVAQLVEFVQLAGQRVEKYRQRAGGTLHLEPLGLAVLSELLVRGSQQPNELTRRVERMQATATPETVQAALDALARNGLVVQQARRSGERYPRWAQLLAPAHGVSAASGSAGSASRPDVGPEAARIAAEIAAGHAHVPGRGAMHAAPPSHEGASAPGAVVPTLTGLRSGVLSPTASRASGDSTDLAMRVGALEAEVATLREQLRLLAARLGDATGRD